MFEIANVVVTFSESYRGKLPWGLYRLPHYTFLSLLDSQLQLSFRLLVRIICATNRKNFILCFN